MKRELILMASLALILAACGGTDEESSDQASESTADVVVFAAASLSTSFPEIAEAQYSFDGSSGLLDQIKGGAPADVFASADQKNMDAAVDAGLVDGEPVMFATNFLVLVAPPDNPGGITGFDSSLQGTKLVVCAPEVPCGAASVAVAEKANLPLAPVSEEQNVTDVLGKVTSGEADAGLVYATDARTAGDAVKVFDIPGSGEDPNTYWIAVLVDAPSPEGARRFIDVITSTAGADVLSEFGFGPAR